MLNKPANVFPKALLYPASDIAFFMAVMDIGTSDCLNNSLIEHIKLLIVLSRAWLLLLRVTGPATGVGGQKLDR